MASRNQKTCQCGQSIGGKGERSLKSLGKKECSDRDEETHESVLIGESSLRENVTEFGKCF